MKPIKVTDEEFEELVLNANQPVLVDFWAEWCGPCKTITPTLDQIAADMSEELTVAKINVDDNIITPSTYGIKGIPTLMIFKDGKLSATKIGSVSPSQLKQWIENNI